MKNSSVSEKTTATVTIDRQIALVLFAATTAIYLRMIAPGLLSGDSGEFQFAAWRLGLAHATGYPLYLLLGWMSIAVIWLMFERLPTGSAVLVIVGGLLYTVGVIFHVWERLQFQRAIWHGFVLAASSCHFTAVAWASLQVAA